MNGGGKTTIFLILIVGAFIGIRLYASPGHAPKPEVFGESTSLTQAMEVSQKTGKPVYALVTADWCGPCQRFKKGTLSDNKVAGFLNDKTVPVYIDVTNEAPSDLVQMGLANTSIPASYLISPNGQYRSTVGAVPSDKFLKWATTAMYEISDQ